MYQSTKLYDHTLGFSCAFRQWRAASHCRFLHGYALSFKFVFETEQLDKCNWAVDFGGLDKLKETLRYWYDHTTIIAHDDPLRDKFVELEALKLVQLRIVVNAGCEAFASSAYWIAQHIIEEKFPHARVVSCEVREHGANSAIYIAPTEQKVNAR